MASGAQALAHALRRNRTVTELNILCDAIGGEGAVEIANLLAEDRCALKELSLDSTDLTEVAVCALARALKVNNRLETLALGNTNMRAAGAQAIGSALAQNSSLHLGDSEIDEEGAKGLAQGMLVNRSVTDLELARNRIGDGGATVMASVIKGNETLTELGLSNNEMGEMGMKALGNALRSNSTLQNLSLSDNPIGAAAQHMAEALACNKGLEELLLNRIGLTGQGLMPLASSLTANCTLTAIDLRGNALGHIGAQGLGEGLKGNNTLKKLDLGRTCMW